MFKRSIRWVGYGLSALPVMALAQGAISSSQGQGLSGVADTIIRLLNTYVIPILIGVGLVWFLYGVIKYITAQGNEEQKGSGRGIMINGIIALVVMVGVWGLVNIIGNTFGVFGGSIPPAPRFP